MSRYLKFSFAALAITTSSHAYAATATFTAGYIGGYQTNSNTANHVSSFLALGISKVEVSDGTANQLFVKPQGNDLSATITVYDNSNNVITSYTGVINWTIKNGSTVLGIGVNAPANTADGYSLVSPDTQRNYILQVNNLLAPSAGTISGSADNRAVDALNAYVVGASDVTAPVVTASQTFSYAENQVAAATVATVAATDNIGVTTFRFSATSTQTSADGYYTIDDAGVIKITAAGVAAGVANNDYEITPNAFTYGIQAGDSAGNWSTATNISLNVTNVDDTAPVVTASQSFSYAENQVANAAVATVAATDAVGVTGFRFGATGTQTSADGYYTIDNAGVIKITTAGVAAGVANNDYEITPNAFTYAIQAGDAAGNWSTATNISLNVTNVNDTPPSFTNTNSTDANNAPAYSFDYPENSAAGTVLGSVAAVGGTGTLTYTITGGNSNGWYAVNPTTGAITLTAAGAASVANDFEQSSNHELLTVAVSDGTTTTTIALKLNETNVNDTPPSFTNMNATGPNNAPSYSFNYAENSAAGATLGSVSAVGVTGTLTYSITGGDPNGWYAINPTTGAITLTAAGAASVANDYEAASNAHALTVQVSDGTQAVTIDVALNETNVDDTAPLITGPSGGAGSATSGISVYEDQTAVTKVTANEAVTWSLTGGPDAAKFVIAADGTITFVAAPDYENPTDADHNNTYIVQITARDAAGNVSVQMLTVTVLNIDEITQKLNAIAPKLRTDLRNYAFGSMQDMLSFNEGLMQDAANGDCTTANRRKGVHGSIRANQNGQNVNLKMSQQLNACATRIRVYLDMGVSASSMGGNANLRSLGSIRAETQVATDVTVGLGVMGSFAADSLTSFAKSSISDESLQGNLYVRAKLSDRLRAGAFGSLGKAWYRFGLHDDGFDLSGRMTGDRYAYGAMLSGDMNLGGIKVTTDVALSRAVEKLHNATLAANYKGESRSGIGFAVGTVDATRLSVPAHVRLISRGDDKMSGRSLILTFSPGLLCEDKSADASSLTCGYQLGGKLAVATSINDRVYLDARHEDVSGNTREMISLGYAHRWGPMELGLTVDRNLSAYRADSRAMLQLRFLGR